jgi:hypothetical protein
VQPHTRPTGFVLDLTPQLTHPDTRDVASEATVSDHAGDIEVVDHDRAVPAYQAGGEFVQAVAARVGDSGVQAGDTQSSRPRGHSEHEPASGVAHSCRAHSASFTHTVKHMFDPQHSQTPEQLRTPCFKG